MLGIVSGINPSIIGGFSGLSAFMGVAATFVSASMVKRLGILKVFPLYTTINTLLVCLQFQFLVLCLVLMNSHYQAGAVGLLLQASLLMIAVAVYWSGTLSQQTPLLFFLCLIVSCIKI